jgi:hypothetical protein
MSLERIKWEFGRLAGELEALRRTLRRRQHLLETVIQRHALDCPHLIVALKDEGDRLDGVVGVLVDLSQRRPARKRGLLLSNRLRVRDGTAVLASRQPEARRLSRKIAGDST